MKLSDLVSWEPINLTNIIISLSALILFLAIYGAQLGVFMDNLGSVEVDLLGGKITLATKPEVVPLRQIESDFEQSLSGPVVLQNFGKSTLPDLRAVMGVLGEEKAVLTYAVSGQHNYYNDELMLEYLSVASRKVKYLQFVLDGYFVGAIEIENVISGIANQQSDYRNFGNKLNSEKWRDFPALITVDEVFQQRPSLQELYTRLKANKREALPLVENQQLVGFLSYKSIADDLYVLVPTKSDTTS